MHSRIARAVAVLALGGSLAACDDFLTDPEVLRDPNRPTEASMDNLLQGIQVNQTVWYTANLPRTTTLWMQQLAGVGRQWVPTGTYDVTESTFSGDFSAVYIGGGLLDMRRLQAMAAERDDRVYAGVAKVWESMLMGMAASMWGDIPYSQAASDQAQPALDDQAAVYAAVQTLLDGAIADLASGQGSGPEGIDLIYGGNAQKWIQAAYTLKARFYMHWVEAAGSAGAQTACGGDCLARAKAAAENGISSPANDMRTYQSGAANEQNMWHQFLFIAREGDVAAGEAMINLLEGRDDPRLETYFAPVASGEYVGAPPGQEIEASQVNIAARGAADFRQPLVTYQENQLILAEVAYRQGLPAVAMVHLNNARAVDGLGTLLPLTGTALIRAIAEEKYIAMFQNLEAWNDMKRLCWPALTPAQGTALPGRLFYGEAERNANPNIPPPGQITDRNDNDPAACS